MRMRAVLVPLLVLALVVLAMGGVGVKMAGQNRFEPFTVPYDYSWLRMVTLTSTWDMSEVVASLRQWAQSDGYEFRTDSPAGERDSVSLLMWKEKVILDGGNRLGNGGAILPGLDFSIYWNGDVPDERALDEAAEQLRAQLAPFGTVEVASAPPGTRPRTESPPFWRGH